MGMIVQKVHSATPPKPRTLIDYKSEELMRNKSTDADATAQIESLIIINEIHIIVIYFSTLFPLWSGSVQHKIL